MNPLIRVGLISATLTLAACSALDGDKIDYRSATKAPSLEVPPDLAQLSQNSRYAVPGTVVSESSYQQGAQATAGAARGKPTVAAQSEGDIRFVRDGSQQWLVVKQPPEKLWDSIRDFWQQSGFVLVLDQPNIGIMETDWAENRAKIPMDFIRSILGKALDTLYSSGEQDKFRTRVERDADGNTEIFISHRGMEEVYTSGNKDSTRWQPRAPDPGLETELLKRLMLKLGGNSEVTRLAAANPQLVPKAAHAATRDGQPVVDIEEPFDRAWRRVGLSLDRTGFTVEDRDRARGVYFVRYVEPGPKKEPGFFSKLFSSTPTTPPMKLRVQLTGAQNSTVVSIQNADGAPEASAVAQRIVTLLADDLQ